VKRFRKASCPIVERLVCSLMFHGRNNGKKLMAVRIVRHTFEIIHLLTGEVNKKKTNLIFSFFIILIESTSSTR
jgi:small subunit ribosomal protein S5e